MATKKTEARIQMTLEAAKQAAAEAGLNLGRYKRKFRIDIVHDIKPVRPGLDLSRGMKLIRDHSESSRHTGS